MRAYRLVIGPLLTLLATAALSAQSALSVGAGPADLVHEFGEIGPVVLLPNGGIVVGDVGRFELAYVPPSRARVQRIGRYGRGPREFLSVAIVVGLGDDRVLVLDVGQRRATVFVADTDSLRFNRSFEAQVPAYRACASGARIFAQGHPTAGPIAVYELTDTTLRRVSTLGAEPRFKDDPPSTMLRAFNQTGIIGCPKEGSRGLAWAPAQRGLVQLVANDGSVANVPVLGFTEPTYQPTDNGLRSRAPAAGYVHVNHSLLWSDGWYVGAVTVSREFERAGRVFVARVDSGRPATLHERRFLPVAVSDRLLACVANVSDEPTLHVRSIADTAWRDACGLR